MNCETIKNQLSAFLDHELAEEQARKVRLHLFKCEDCQAAADELRSVYKLFDGKLALQMDSYFTTRVNAEIDARLSRKRKKIPEKILLPIGILTGVLLGVLITTGIHTKFSTPDSQYNYINYEIFSTAPTGSFTAGYMKSQNIQINQEVNDE